MNPYGFPFDFKSNAYTNSATRARYARPTLPNGLTLRFGPRFANGLLALYGPTLTRTGLHGIIISHDSGDCHCGVAGGGDELTDGFGAAVADGINAFAGGLAVFASYDVTFFV